MLSRVLVVYYDSLGYPFKNKELSTRYPLVGNAFMGSSKTAEIRFYVDELGGTDGITWVVNGKLPNGKQGSKVLVPQQDNEGYWYVPFVLSSFFTQAKGDLTLSLAGYVGDIIYEYDIEQDIYVIQSTPTIQTTGSIKINIAYSVGLPSDQVVDMTMEQYLSLLGGKLDIVKSIVVTNFDDPISSIVASNYEYGQVFFNKKDEKLYINNSGTIELYYETYSQTETDTLLNQKADKTHVDTELANKVNLAGSNDISANNTFSGNNTFTGSNVFNTAPQTNDSDYGEGTGTKLTTKNYVVGIKSDLETSIGNIGNRVTTIESEIPSQASSSNKLADRDWVNSTINSLAAFYITKNAQGEPFATYSELASATTFYSGGQVRVPTRNDYCLVVSDENHDNASCRYIYQGTQWEFQFVVNETPFTADQVAALNSGITSALVSQIGTNTNAISTINSKLPITKDYVVATNLWQLVNGKYVAELDAGVDFVIDDNAMHIYTPTSNNDQLLRDTYGINVSSDQTTQKFTFTCNIGNSAPSEVINFTIAQFGGN